MSEYWIPITLIIMFSITICVALVLSSRHKRDVQLTLREMIHRDQPVTPELLKNLVGVKSPKAIDLRRGLILIFTSLACLFCGVLAENLKLALAIGVFPFFIGAALLISWKVNQYDE